MRNAATSSQLADGKSGLISGIAAYTMWGMFPFYFVATKQVPALEILAYRVLFSLPFGALILVFRRQIAETLRAMATPKTLGLLTLAGIALAANWGFYIWAVQHDQIFQGSLGYYINPLLYVVVGVLFFQEKLSRWQGAAILLALIGVLILTFYGGVFPWISLVLAGTFTIYGVIRKAVNIGAMPGLMVEVVMLTLPAVAVIIFLSSQSAVSFGQLGRNMDLLLMLAGPITVLPLLAFAYAARRIKLSTLGVLQFIGPTLQFCCAIYFGETFTVAHGWCFGLIWLGVAIFSFDAWRNRPVLVA